MARLLCKFPRFSPCENSDASFEHPNVSDDQVLVEPGLAFTVHDIYSRFVSGMPISGLIRNTFYSSDDEDDDFIDPAYRQNQDLTDNVALANELAELRDRTVRLSKLQTTDGNLQTTDGTSSKDQSSNVSDQNEA